MAVRTVLIKTQEQLMHPELKSYIRIERIRFKRILRGVPNNIYFTGLSFFGFFVSFLESFPLAIFSPLNDKYLTVFSIASSVPY